MSIEDAAHLLRSVSHLYCGDRTSQEKERIGLIVHRDGCQAEQKAGASVSAPAFSHILQEEE